jgi:hypothetical protein
VTGNISPSFIATVKSMVTSTVGEAPQPVPAPAPAKKNVLDIDIK